VVLKETVLNMRFCKRLRGLLSLAILASCALLHAQTKPDIGRYTVGDLPTSRLNAPGIAGLCLLTDGNSHVSIAACPAGSGGSGSGTFPQSLANASHKWLNSYDANTGLFTQTQPASTALADFSATAPTTAGKIPIFDPTAPNSAGGTGAYVPGDPLVQGLFADDSTSAENPVAIGGYDTAGTPAIHRATFINGTPGGTEYGIITRNIPSGTQPISGTIAVSNFPATQPISGSVSVSNFPATQPVSIASSVTVAQAAGTNLHTVVDSAPTTAITASALPLPTGASTAAKQPALGTAGTPSPDVITVQGAASGTALKTDSSATTQPVSIASTVQVSLANTAANATAVKTDGSGVTQPVSVASSVTVAQATGTNLHVVVDSAPTTAITAVALPLATGAATSANQSTVKAASTASVATDTSSVVQLSPNQPQLTTPLNVQGATANVAPPARTEGNQAALSVDLHGNLRVYGHPPDVLGCYMVNGRTGTYAALAAGSPLYSFRWSSSTALAVIMRVKVSVTTVTAATVAGQAERELIVARSFSVSDTGGTAVTLTGNNQKMRTSMATSLVGDMRFGQPLTAGTRTLDSAPIASAVAWLPLLFTGVDIGCGGAANTTTANSCMGGIGMIELLNATNGQDYPLVLAQNEGFIVRIGKDAQPTTAVQQTYVNVSWCEVSAF
jgi:hypothetical protein